MPFPVEHNTVRNRFEARVDGQLCVADYQLSGGVMHVTHTFVPPEVEGRGVAAALVRAALAYAGERGLRVNPACSYVRKYMRRHPETQSLHA